MSLSLANMIVSTAIDSLDFELLPSQRSLLYAAAEFAAAAAPRDVFLLNGYAGTGKTSLVGALIHALTSLRRRVVLLAPTGRAAKVASAFAQIPASTIHHHILRPDFSNPSSGIWHVARNIASDTLYVVDEASLINDSPSGSANILASLVAFVYSAPGCHLMLVGDEAQLPPVGQLSSSAMDPDRLRRLGLNPICFSLDLPVRQAADSGIVLNATIVRSCLETPPAEGVPTLRLSGMNDIQAISSADLADALTDSYAQVGMDDTIIITRSNRRANDFNRAVRNMVLFAEEPLERGDRVVVSKNDYYWGRKNKTAGLIANGDAAEVTWVGKTEKVYGRYFTEVELSLSDGSILSAKVMLRSLVCEGPSIPADEMDRFRNVVMAACDGEVSQRLAALSDDPYYNALQVKYAYCVTCHKAQGGQWRHVYIDMGGITPDSMGTDFYRWLYTAITRASEKVFLINPTILIS